MEINFHPYNQPSFKGKIELPNENKEYQKEYYNKNYYFQTQSLKDINIDLEKLNTSRSNDANSYTLEELKEFAKRLNIEKISGLSKSNLIKNIKLKLKLN